MRGGLRSTSAVFAGLVGFTLVAFLFGFLAVLFQFFQKNNGIAAGLSVSFGFQTARWVYTHPYWETAPVHAPPGSRILSVVRWLPVSQKAIDRVFVPVVADFQREYIEALHAGKNRLAVAIRVRYYLILAITFWTFIGAAAVKRAVEVWRLI